MKIQKYTKTSISIILTLLLSYGLVSAWTNLASVNTGDSLTSTVWNNMATKLNDIGNRVTGISSDGSGKVGIGITVPSYKFHVRDTSYGTNSDLSYESLNNVGPTLKLSSLSNIYTQMVFNQQGADQVYLRGSSYGLAIGGTAPRLNIGYPDANYTNGSLVVNGNVGIGTTSPGYKLTVNGQPAANGYTAFTNYSDKRLKENIKTLTGGLLDKVLRLNPVTYQYNDKYFDVTGYDKSTKEKVYKGFIAQELREIFPEMVNKKGEYLDTDLSSLQIYILKAVQELEKEKNTQINELKKENDKKDKQIDDLSRQNIEILKRLEKLENK